MDNLTVGGNRVIRAKDLGVSPDERLSQYISVITAIPAGTDCQKLTIGTTGGTLASFCAGAVLPANMTHALVQAAKTNTGKVFWRDDGVQVDATIGMFELAAGDQAEWVRLPNVTLDADAAGQVLYVSFRRYDIST